MSKIISKEMARISLTLKKNVQVVWLWGMSLAMASEERGRSSSLTCIDWLQKLNAKDVKEANDDEVTREESIDRSLPDMHKPPYTYEKLVFMAIEHSPQFMSSVSHICQWIECNFPYFKTCPDLKNTVRYTLLTSQHFVRLTNNLSSNCSNNMSYWTINFDKSILQQQSMQQHQSHGLNYLMASEGAEMCPVNPSDILLEPQPKRPHFESPEDSEAINFDLDFYPEEEDLKRLLH